MVERYVWPSIERDAGALDVKIEKYNHLPEFPYPVPAGETTIAAYAESYGLTALDFPPALLPNHPNAWIMFVMKRKRPEGTVTLYGLGEEREERRDGPLETNSWVENMQWNFTRPVLQTEYTSRPRPYDDPLGIEVRRLWDFYTTHVMNQRVDYKRRPGRRPGPTMARVEMRRKYDAAVAEAQDHGCVMSVTSVAAFMEVPRTTLSDWIINGYLPEIPE